MTSHDCRDKLLRLFQEASKDLTPFELYEVFQSAARMAEVVFDMALFEHLKKDDTEEKP